jgi:hypothetical protein
MARKMPASYTADATYYLNEADTFVAAGPRPSLKDLGILVVDDEPGAREVTSAILTDAEAERADLPSINSNPEDPTMSLQLHPTYTSTAEPPLFVGKAPTTSGSKRSVERATLFIAPRFEGR